MSLLNKIGIILIILNQGFILAEKDCPAGIYTSPISLVGLYQKERCQTLKYFLRQAPLPRVVWTIDLILFVVITTLFWLIHSSAFHIRFSIKWAIGVGMLVKQSIFHICAIHRKSKEVSYFIYFSCRTRKKIVVNILRGSSFDLILVNTANLVWGEIKSSYI